MTKTTHRISESTLLTITSSLQRVRLRSPQMGEMHRARTFRAPAGKTTLPAPWKLPGPHHEGVPAHTHDPSHRWPSMIKSFCSPSPPTGFPLGPKDTPATLLAQEIQRVLFTGQNSSSIFSTQSFYLHFPWPTVYGSALFSGIGPQAFQDICSFSPKTWALLHSPPASLLLLGRRRGS